MGLHSCDAKNDVSGVVLHAVKLYWHNFAIFASGLDDYFEINFNPINSQFEYVMNRL